MPHHMRVVVLTLLTTLLTLNLVTIALAYSHGGPVRSCQTLIPSHGADKQYGAAPYTIQAKKAVNGGNVVVTIGAKNQPLAGFMLQARYVSDRERVVNGRFSEDRYVQTRNCNGDVPNTLTHRSSSPKYKVETTWTPPREFTGSVIFRATIVQSKSVYWTALDSHPIQITSQTNGKPISIASSGGGIKYEEDSDNDNTSSGDHNDNHIATNHNNNNQQQFDDNINSPSLSRSSQANPTAHHSVVYNHINYEVCEKKFCFGLPVDCVKYRGCVMLLSGGFINYFSDGIAEFEVQADAKSASGDASGGYFSVGLSSDNKMGDDSVTDCVISDGEPQIRNSVNVGKANEPLANNEFHGVTPLNTSLANGILYCKWRRLRRSIVRGSQYDLRDKKYYILLAYGPLRADVKKARHFETLVSDDAVDIKIIGHISAYSKMFLVKIHGSFMIIAWLGCVSIGIFMARYYKSVWQSKSICGVRVWFAMHRSLMILTVIVISMSLISIYIYAGSITLGTHQLFGFSAIIIAFCQPIGATFRPNADSSKRWIFNWAHWLWGNVAHVCAIVALFLAHSLPASNLPQIYVWLLVLYLLFHILSHLMMQFYTCNCRLRKKTGDISLRDISGVATEAKFAILTGNAFLRYYIGIYSVLIVSFVLALIACIVIPQWHNKRYTVN